MRTLRVLLSAPPDPARSDAWALFDASGRVLERGRGVPADWPAADRHEAVLTADVARVVALELPPMAPTRVAAAAAYALEDQLAGNADQVVLAAGPRSENGQVSVVVAARALVAALARATPRFERILAEPALATTEAGTWRWCDGSVPFVCRDRGGAFAVSAASGDGLPAELGVALGQAARAGTSPERVVASHALDAARLAAYAREGGVPFVAGPAWSWDAAPPSAFARAPDLLASAPRSGPQTPPRSALARFAPALAIAAIAIALHAVATLGTWAWRKVELWQAGRDLAAVAREAGVADATPANAAAALARRHAAVRHRAGLTAPADALPSLARAAPALAALPAGALKSANYAAGAWTLELAALPEPELEALQSRLAAQGLPPLTAKTASGVRARFVTTP